MSDSETDIVCISSTTAVASSLLICTHTQTGSRMSDLETDIVCISCASSLAVLCKVLTHGGGGAEPCSPKAPLTAMYTTPDRQC